MPPFHLFSVFLCRLGLVLLHERYKATPSSWGPYVSNLPKRLKGVPLASFGAVEMRGMQDIVLAGKIDQRRARRFYLCALDALLFVVASGRRRLLCGALEVVAVRVLWDDTCTKGFAGTGTSEGRHRHRESTERNTFFSRRLQPTLVISHAAMTIVLFERALLSKITLFLTKGCFFLLSTLPSSACRVLRCKFMMGFIKRVLDPIVPGPDAPFGEHRVTFGDLAWATAAVSSRAFTRMYDGTVQESRPLLVPFMDMVNFNFDRENVKARRTKHKKG